MISNTQAIEYGRLLIDLLGLKIKPNGRVDTAWGDKTPLGLGLTVHRIQEEVLNAKRETYLDEPNRCPQCGGGDMEGGPVDVDNTRAAQVCMCTDCGASWIDYYRLESFEIIKGDKPVC